MSKRLDHNMVFGMVMGAARNYNNDHPDRAVHMGDMRSIAKRCSVDIFAEARRRGLPAPEDQVVDASYKYERTKKMRPA